MKPRIKFTTRIKDNRQIITQTTISLSIDVNIDLLYLKFCLFYINTIHINNFYINSG